MSAHVVMLILTVVSTVVIFTNGCTLLYFVKMTMIVSLISNADDNRKFVMLTNLFIILTNSDYRYNIASVRALPRFVMK
jgi:hypothetical protein